MITSIFSCVLARRAFVRSSMIEIPGVSSMNTGSPCSAAAGRDPAYLERSLHAVGEMLVVGLQRGRDVTQLRVCRFVAEREEPLLGAVGRGRDVGRLVVLVRRDRRGRAQEAPQYGPVADDAAVSLDLGGGRNDLRECAEVGLASDSIELLAPCELHLDGERIDPLPPLEERQRRVVNALMARDVEVVDAEEIRHLEDGVAIDEQAPEHLLLGSLVEGHLPVGCAGLERHECESRTCVRLVTWASAAMASRRKPTAALETLASTRGGGNALCPPSPPPVRPQRRTRHMKEGATPTCAFW